MTTFGQIRSDSKTRIRPSFVRDDDRSGLVVARHDEHWDGRQDATVFARPGAAFGVGAAVNRRLIREHNVARYGEAAVAAREEQMALSADGIFWATQLDIIDATALAVNTASDTFDIRLLDNTTTPNFDTHLNWSDLSSGEVSGTGYTADGAALSGLSVAISTGLNWDATDPQWTSSTITAHGAVVVDDTLANDPMICLIYFGGAVSSSGGNFDITFAAGGFLQGDNA